ncbi:MAG: YunC family protein [Bacillota bacterium]
MVNLTPILIEGEPFTAVTVKLPKTNFMAVANDYGYIMCGALDVALLNDKLKERGIIAGRAVGVRTIDQLLDAPLESITFAAEELGIHVGMSGREALLKMAK